MNPLALIGAGVSAVGAIKNIFKGDGRKEQLEQQEALTRQQTEASKQLMLERARLDMQMWKNTNASAQVAEYKKAGINPALMLGMSGAQGGTTGNSAPAAAGGTAEGASVRRQADTQMALLGAQIANLNSQTNKNNAEAEATAGVNTTKTATETSAIAQGINNAKAAEELTKAETRLKSLQGQLQEGSMEYMLDKIAQEANKAQSEAQSAFAQANVDEKTVSERIAMLKSQATNLAIETVAKRTGIALDNAKITEITASIQQKWKDLNISDTKSRYEHEDRLKAIEEYTSTTLKAAGIQAAGAVIRDVVGIATRKLPTGSTTITDKYDGFGNPTGRTETITRPNR